MAVKGKAIIQRVYNDTLFAVDQSRSHRRHRQGAASPAAVLKWMTAPALSGQENRWKRKISPVGTQEDRSVQLAAK